MRRVHPYKGYVGFDVQAYVVKNVARQMEKNMESEMLGLRSGLWDLGLSRADAIFGLVSCCMPAHLSLQLTWSWGVRV